jgi:hypothetical protein
MLPKQRQVYRLSFFYCRHFLPWLLHLNQIGGMIGMPTIAEIIAKVDELRPNRFSDTLKIGWCSDVDIAIRNDLIPVYTSHLISRVKDQTAYDLPEGVQFDDIVLVSVDGKQIDKIDIRSQNKLGFYYMDGKINFYPVPGQTDTAPGIKLIAKERLTPYTDTEQELIAPVPYSRIYEWYLFAMIKYFDDDIEGYNNDMQQFNTAWDEYAKYIQRGKPSSPLKSKNYM